MEAWWRFMKPLIRRFVTWDMEGLERVIVYVLRCDTNERIVDARVALAGKNEIPGGRDDTVVWRIHSRTGVGLDSMIVGQLHAGFDETVPLDRTLDQSREYFALVETEVEAIAWFKLAQLRSDRVL
jgi:hypothetical protein